MFHLPCFKALWRCHECPSWCSWSCVEQRRSRSCCHVGPGTGRTSATTASGDGTSHAASSCDATQPLLQCDLAIGATGGRMWERWIGGMIFAYEKKNPELNYRERCSIGWYMVGYLGDDRTSQLHVHEWYEWAVWLFFSSWCERKRVMWSWGYEKL